MSISIFIFELSEIKPIVGCEFNICDDHKDKTKKDNGYQVVLLAFFAPRKAKFRDTLVRLGSLVALASLIFVLNFTQKYLPLTIRLSKQIVQKLLNCHNKFFM